MPRHPAFAALLLLAGIAAGARAQGVPPQSTGQTIYLPIYSFIWHGDIKQGAPARAQLSALVSIRNTDLARPIRIVSARYYDTAGKLVKEFLPAPQNLGPMATHELFVEKSDSAGGSGANFVIVWDAPAPASPPLVEAVHSDVRGHSTLVFVTSGRIMAPAAIR